MVWQEENQSNFDLQIALDNKELQTFTFNKDTILNQESIKISPLNDLEFEKLLPLTFSKTNNNEKKNNFYYDIAMKYFLPTENLTARDEGFTITRKFFQSNDANLVTPVSEAKVGDILKGKLEIIVPEQRHFVAIEDFLPAGVELINFDLATENQVMVENEQNSESKNEFSEQNLNPDVKELRDDRLFIFKEYLNPGTYTFKYYVRVLIPGEFNHLPAIISEMYFPENFGRTEGEMFVVKE